MKKVILLLVLLSFIVISSRAQDTVIAKGIDDQKAEKLYNEGISLFDKKEYNDALAKFNEAIALKPEFEKAYYTEAPLNMNLKIIWVQLPILTNLLKRTHQTIKHYSAERKQNMLWETKQEL